MQGVHGSTMMDDDVERERGTLRRTAVSEGIGEAEVRTTLAKLKRKTTGKTLPADEREAWAECAFDSRATLSSLAGFRAYSAGALGMSLFLEELERIGFLVVLFCRRAEGVS